jgi:hypothetical protein
MSKKKIDETEAEETETETANQKFHRIVTHRAENLAKAYNLITRLPKQPSYDVTQEDAQKLLAWVNDYHELFIKRYTPIANGEKISRSGEKEITEIF